MKIATIVQKIYDKLMLIYRKRLFKEKTGNNVDTLKILGHLSLINCNVKIGNNVTFFEGVTIFGDEPVIIGDRVCIGQNTIIYSSRNGGGVTIGSDTQIAGQCYIIDTDHGVKAGDLIRNQPNTTMPVVIGNDVWIASGCKILKGSKIGNGAIVGAQSVVKGEIPENSICFGIPAHVAGYRK